jgi:hypothetical protein
VIRLALALVAATIPLSATSSVRDGLFPRRMVDIAAHTAPGARCTVSDTVSAIHRTAKASKTGRVAWHWHPSVWSSGPDTVTVRCAKGRARQTAETFFVLGTLPQIGLIRHFALHLVYWAPAGDMPRDVAPAVMRLESDIKASLDAGATDNPFAIPRAYRDALGPGDPRIASIDAMNDSDRYPTPPAACRGVPSPCLASGNIGDEVTKLARKHRWATGNHTLIMVFTSPALTICYGAGTCSRANEPCGYHAITSGGYAYADVLMSGCGGSGTNGAGYAIELICHEQNEAIVDPWGTGFEVADKCEGDFRTVTINGHPYRLPAILQRGSCAFGYTPR